MACMNRVAIIVLLLSVAVFPSAAQELLPRWEAIDIAKGVDLHANEMKALIEQVRPKEWIQDGCAAGVCDSARGVAAEIWIA